MKPNLDAQIALLQSSISKWDQVYPNLPAVFPYQNNNSVPKEVLNTFLIETFTLLKEIGQSEDIPDAIFYIHQPGLINSINQSVQALNNLPGNPPANMQNLFNYVWSMRASMLWLIPPSKFNNNQMDEADLPRTVTAVNAMSKSLAMSLKETEKIKQRINETSTEAKSIIEKIKGFEREAGNAKLNSETNASAILGNKENIDQLSHELIEALDKLKDNRSEIDALYQEAKSLFENTSKVAMARSFTDRRTSLGRVQKFWAVSFIFGIAILVFGVWYSNTVSTYLAPLVETNGKLNIWGIVTRILLGSPIVWFCWFAVRQYGHTMKLIEDYAFKEATALAYVGYRNEIGEDPKMESLLKEVAIKNFGMSPTRLLGKSDPASPLNEMFENAFEKGYIDKLIEFVKAINPKKR